MNVVRRNQFLYFVVALVLGVIGYRGLTKSEVAQLGSPSSARLLAAKYVGTSKGVERVEVNEAPDIHEDRATVKTIFGANKGCTVSMVRSEAEKEYGWLVEAISCYPAS